MHAHELFLARCLWGFLNLFLTWPSRLTLRWGGLCRRGLMGRKPRGHLWLRLTTRFSDSSLVKMLHAFIRHVCNPEIQWQSDIAAIAHASKFLHARHIWVGINLQLTRQSAYGMILHLSFSLLGSCIPAYVKPFKIPPICVLHEKASMQITC